MQTTERIKDFVITVTEIAYGKWQYIATRYGEYYTGTVKAVGENEALCNAEECVSE